MKIAFYASDKPREQRLADNFLQGAALSGHEVEKCRTNEMLIKNCDIACMVGVKSRALWSRVITSGIMPLMFDKGYVRDREAGKKIWKYWRMSMGAHHPTNTTLMMQKKPSDRWLALGIEAEPYRRSLDGPIIIAGSSQKYHDFYGMIDPNSYARDMVSQLRRFTDREIIYRPKPSWRGAHHLSGTTYSGPKDPLQPLLTDAHCVVTHGSNICFEAAISGVPTIVVGDGVGAAISRHRLSDIERPSMGKRDQWLNNLAYHQWTEAEMRKGLAWAQVEQWFEGLNHA